MSDLKMHTTPSGNHSIERETDFTDFGTRASSATPTLQDVDAEKGPQSKLPNSDAPDGGTAAWLVVLGAWCTSFCSFGWLNSSTTSHHISAQHSF
jgi:hypothetical protein